VLNLFKERNISHAPVMRKGKLVGIISTQDIIDHFFQPEKREKVGEKIGSKTEIINAPVKNAITRPPITITPETSLKEAEQKMHDYDDCALLAVVDERIVGIATKKDFLEPIAQIGMETPRLTIQFSGRDVEIDEAQRDFMTKDFEILSSKYEKTLELGTLFVYIKRQRATHEGEQLFQCRLHLKTVKGSFFSTAEGWGVEATFRIALERIERQILRSKQFAHYPEFARNYLELLYPEEF
jgi:ribosome-associated translation inhibitor RaiA